MYNLAPIPIGPIALHGQRDPIDASISQLRVLNTELTGEELQFLHHPLSSRDAALELHRKWMGYENHPPIGE